MLLMASDWLRSPLAGRWLPGAPEIPGTVCTSGNLREPELEDMTEDETEVGEAGDRERWGLVEEDEEEEDEDEEPPFWQQEAAGELTGALYVQTIRSFGINPSGRGSNSVFKLEVTSSSMSISTALIEGSFWNCRWSSDREVRTKPKLEGVFLLGSTWTRAPEVPCIPSRLAALTGDVLAELEAL